MDPESPPEYTFSSSLSSTQVCENPSEAAEATEVLPGYSTAISLKAIFFQKMEFRSVVCRARNRAWRRVHVALQGTALSIHQYRRAGILEQLELGAKGSKDTPVECRNGELLKSYNLMHAEVGIAIDYHKRKHVLRVRAETHQFLLSCQQRETLNLWLQFLTAAIDLSPPLDERKIPRHVSDPRPLRRPRYLRPATNIHSPVLLRQQRDIIQQRFPNLRHGATMETMNSSNAHPRRKEQLQAGNGMPSRSYPYTNASKIDGPDSSIGPDGKWRPKAEWSPDFDMQYAQRCRAVLYSYSPRKSNYVIMNGKQWVVDSVTGKLTTFVEPEPPEYCEVEKEKEEMIP